MCREVELDYVDRGEGVCYRLLCSVSCLQQLHHPHIVPLVFINLETQRNQLRLFYEDAGNPLEEELKHGRALSLADARVVLEQVLQALAHCHEQGITHRNLKPKYMLLRRPSGRQTGWQVKLSDFNSVRWLGVQRLTSADEPVYGSAQVAGACSPTVVTQPYRAPEILLGCTSYDTSIDIWACGCVFAEMCSSQILFAGDSDIGQLIKIFDLLGTPGPDKAVQWPGVEHLPYYSDLFPAMRPKSLASNPATQQLCASPAAEDLLRRMLHFDPAKRITAAEALRHPFLTPPSPPTELTPKGLVLHQPRDISPDATVAAGVAAHGDDGAVSSAADGAAGSLAQREVGISDDGAGNGWRSGHGTAASMGCQTPDGVTVAATSVGSDFPKGSNHADVNQMRVAGDWSCSATNSTVTRMIDVSGYARSSSRGSHAGGSGSMSGFSMSVWDVWCSVEAAQRGSVEWPSSFARCGRGRSSPSDGGCGGCGDTPGDGVGASITSSGGSTSLLTHRELAVQWIQRSALEFCKCDRTVHLAVGILDHVICMQPEPTAAPSIVDGTGSWIELLGIAALLLACKFQEVEIHTVEEFVYYADARYDSADALEAEVRICSVLRLDFAIPTALDFLFCLLQRLQWPLSFAVHRGMHKEVVMLAQLLCDLSLLSNELAVCPRSSLVASCALCLSLACLRCGCWRDGSPGPSSAPELYWTASMAQATGYTRADLSAPMSHLQAIHEVASANVGVFADDGLWDKWSALRHKFGQPRFLNVLLVPPFTPHAGGSIFPPLHAELGVHSTRLMINPQLNPPPAPVAAFDEGGGEIVDAGAEPAEAGAL